MGFLIVWQDAWESMLTYARYQMLQLWALTIARLYYHLLSPITLLVLTASVSILFFIPKTDVVLGLVQMLWIARLCYLARPSVGLKDKQYRLEFIGYNLSFATGTYVIAVGIARALVPWYVWALCVVISPLFFFFLYDGKHQFPGNFLRALRQTCTMTWDILPLIVIWACLYELLYGLMHFLPQSALVHMAFLIPIHVGFMMLIYCISLHKHFEWYYA